MPHGMQLKTASTYAPWHATKTASTYAPWHTTTGNNSKAWYQIS